MSLRCQYNVIRVYNEDLLLSDDQGIPEVRGAHPRPTGSSQTRAAGLRLRE